ncbi:MAG: hypothetical protein OER96_09040, partial [Gammaproteobacteria bacterium]|nr:hypothetical protein [Gammaproteobacteria bacterium]
SRQFLHWINRWAEQGFEPILKNWRQRANGINEYVSIALKDETVTGNFTSIESNGAIAVSLADHSIRHVSLGEFYNLI